MARLQEPGHQLVYAAAEQWIDAALKSDDSLFTPGIPIWSKPWLEDLHERFVLNEDTSGDPFIVKLERQLFNAPPETIQLMGEAVFLQLLVASPDSMGGKAKTALVRGVLGISAEPVDVPPDIIDTLGYGLAGTGVAFMVRRPFHLQYIIEVVRAWDERSRVDQDKLLEDPWEFRAFLFGVRMPPGAQGQRDALLHLVHPATFEIIVSQRAKKRIAKAFNDLVSNPDDDVDRRLAEIRRRLSEDYGPDYQYWYPEVIRLWQNDTSQWGQFSQWARRFFERQDFGPNERDYKLTLAERLQTARDAVLADDEWLDPLKKAFGHPNNLTPWRTNGAFLRWCEAQPEVGRQALVSIWEEGKPVPDRIRGFLSLLPKEVLSGVGGRATLASYLLMAIDPLTYPIYQTTPYRKAFQLTGYGKRPKDADEAHIYEYALEYLDAFASEAEAHGLQLRDRLDAQSLMWVITTWPIDQLPDDIPEREREALRRYRGDEQPVGPGGGATTTEAPEQPTDGEPDHTETLADLSQQLLLDEEWLQNVVALLGDKKQAIFYGPPGTGKTYVARKLARYLAADGGEVELVQFHPSYAYEDFVEGYRPTALAGGTPGFKLRNGPLKRIAEAASGRPDVTHVLIIDEINRGNVAKVFGELYFLLEYRKEDIALQYSDDNFALPENLWIIGTMNTTDRTIALIDAALRRRFHFAPFFPTEPPVKGLLARWLKRHQQERAWIADVVDHANEMLGDRHMAIGPSHFMRENLTLEWVERIWAHSIVPYLEEHFFSEPERIEEFNLNRLRAAVGDSTAEDADEGTSAE